MRPISTDISSGTSIRSSRLSFGGSFDASFAEKDSEGIGFTSITLFGTGAAGGEGATGCSYCGCGGAGGVSTCGIVGAGA